MIQVKLGNAAPHDTLPTEVAQMFSGLSEEELGSQGFQRYGDYIIRPLPELGEVVTEVAHPYNEPVELVMNIKKMWAQHSTKNPVWVWSSDPLVSQLIVREFPGCVIKEDQ